MEQGQRKVTGFLSFKRVANLCAKACRTEEQNNAISTLLMTLTPGGFLRKCHVESRTRGQTVEAFTT